MKVEKKYFGTLCDGSEVSLYTVSNGKMQFSVTDFGCTITSILVPSKSGSSVDVILGHSTLEGYITGTGSHGALVGRFANRIKGGEFVLDGKKISLDINSSGNCLHGGFNRMEKMLWKSESFESNSEAGVVFTRTSTEAEQGFPGNVEFRIVYSLNSENEIKLKYEGTTDKATPINLTNHAYFNLAGKGSILSHKLTMNSDKYLEVDEFTIPKGEPSEVKGTPFDFTKGKIVGSEIEKVSPGYDHCFVTENYASKASEMVEFALLEEDSTGIKMRMFTNQVGVQLYTGNFLDGFCGKNGTIHNRHDGICLESEGFPDSVNHPDFPQCIVRPGEKYNSETIYKFEF